MFKRCPNCGFEWPERDGFLSDPDLALVGYQINYRQLTAGIFLFNHVCKGTLAIHAIDFRDFYAGPVFKESATGTAACPGHCLHEDDLGPCPVQCECAYVRRILQIVKTWPKATDRSALGSA